MTMICAVTVISIALTFAMAPRICWAVLKRELVVLRQQEVREIEERQARVQGHLRYSLILLLLVWPVRLLPGVEVPSVMTAIAASYALSALLLAMLEGALAQKIDDVMAGGAEAGKGAESPTRDAVQQRFHQATQQVREIYAAEKNERDVHKASPDRIWHQRRPAEIIVEVPKR